MRVKKHTVTALLLSASLLCAGCSGFPGPSAQTGTGTAETENADSLTEDSEDYTTSDYDAHYNSLFGEDYIRPWMDADIQGVLEQSGPRLLRGHQPGLDHKREDPGRLFLL